MHSRLLQLGLDYPDIRDCLPDAERAYEELLACYRGGGKLLVCGNGGSAADCEHIVGELMKGFMKKRPLPADRRQALAAFPDGAHLAQALQSALPALSLVSHSALFTAFANDVDADLAFAQQVNGYGRAGDVLLGVSTSGRAKNVVYALQTARSLEMRTIGLTGRTGGRMAEFCDVTVRVPRDGTPAVQERHLPIYHALCIMVEEAFFEV